MPLTSTPAVAGSNMKVDVSDGPGGGPNDQTVDMMVSWDPMRVKCSFPYPSGGLTSDLANGIATWTKIYIPATTKQIFKVSFVKLTDPAYINVAVANPTTGEHDSDQVALP